MPAPDRDEYGNPTTWEKGTPFWPDLVSAVVAHDQAGALLFIERPERSVSMARYDEHGLPVAIVWAVPHAEETCCGRRQLYSLVAMTRADQRRRGHMRRLYRELDQRGYCVLHPYRIDRTPDGAALATAIASELDPTGERRPSGATSLHPLRQ